MQSRRSGRSACSTMPSCAPLSSASGARTSACTAPARCGASCAGKAFGRPLQRAAADAAARPQGRRAWARGSRPWSRNGRLIKCSECSWHRAEPALGRRLHLRGDLDRLVYVAFVIRVFAPRWSTGASRVRCRRSWCSMRSMRRCTLAARPRISSTTPIAVASTCPSATASGSPRPASTRP